MLKTQSFMRGDIEGTSRGVNIVDPQYCATTTRGRLLIPLCIARSSPFDCANVASPTLL